MELIDKFNNLLIKVGVDKILHRLVGDKVTLLALSTSHILSEGSQNALLWTDIIIGVLLLSASIVKEKMDETTDYMDVVWAMGGWILSSVYIWILWSISN